MAIIQKLPAFMRKNYENLLKNSVALANANMVPQDNVKPAYYAALEAELQKQFLDQNPQLKPKAGSKFNQELMMRNNTEFEKYRLALTKEYNDRSLSPATPGIKDDGGVRFLEQVLNYNAMDSKTKDYLNRLKSQYGKTTGIPTGAVINPPVAPVFPNNPVNPPVSPVLPSNPVNQFPGNIYRGGRDDNKLKTSGSAQQMQDYNRMLQQGVQNSNAMNEVAMNNFANMQPGMTNQNNSGDMYRSLQPSFAQIGPARTKSNPMISQNFGSIPSGIGNIMPKTPKPF